MLHSSINRPSQSYPHHHHHHHQQPHQLQQQQQQQQYNTIPASYHSLTSIHSHPSQYESMIHNQLFPNDPIPIPNHSNTIDSSDLDELDTAELTEVSTIEGSAVEQQYSNHGNNSNNNGNGNGNGNGIYPHNNNNNSNRSNNGNNNSNNRHPRPIVNTQSNQNPNPNPNHSLVLNSPLAQSQVLFDSTAVINTDSSAAVIDPNTIPIEYDPIEAAFAANVDSVDLTQLIQCKSQALYTASTTAAARWKCNPKRGPLPIITGIELYRLTVLNDYINKYSSLSAIELIELIDKEYQSLPIEIKQQYINREETDKQRYQLQAKQFLPISNNNNNPIDNNSSNNNNNKRLKSDSIIIHNNIIANTVDQIAAVNINNNNPSAILPAAAAALSAPIKPSISGFTVFSTIHRNKLLAAFSEKSLIEINLYLASLWKSMDSTAKKEYQDKAAEEKLKFKQQQQQQQAVADNISSSGISEDQQQHQQQPQQQLQQQQTDIDNNDIPSSSTAGRHPLAPRHPLSGYLIFISMHRSFYAKQQKQRYQQLQAAAIANNQPPIQPLQSPTFKQVARILSDKWQQMSVDERKPFEFLAVADRQRYELERLEYKKLEIEYKLPPLTQISTEAAAALAAASPTNIIPTPQQQPQPQSIKNDNKLIPVDPNQPPTNNSASIPPTNSNNNPITDIIDPNRLSVSAYQIWSSEQRKSFAAKNPHLGSRDLTRLLKENWKYISKEQKLIYEQQAQSQSQQQQFKSNEPIVKLEPELNQNSYSNSNNNNNPHYHSSAHPPDRPNLSPGHQSNSATATTFGESISPSNQSNSPPLPANINTITGPITTGGILSQSANSSQAHHSATATPSGLGSGSGGIGPEIIYNESQLIVSNWSPLELCEFLSNSITGCGLPLSTAERLVVNGLTGELLLRLTSIELRDIYGITAIGERKKILKTVQQLAENNLIPDGASGESNTNSPTIKPINR